MKIRIELEPQLDEPEIVIRCKELDATVLALQQNLQNAEASNEKIVFYKGDTEFFLTIDEILFFETSNNEVWAHTINDEYQVHYKLYELEDKLPRHFIRVSKSAILNSKKVYSIVRNLTASSKVEFAQTPKTVYVSRNYYKALKDRLSFGINN